MIDVSGVGYLVSCSTRTLGGVGKIGERVSLLIETLMRAESLQLYGFGTSEERDCFRLLVTVQGVGMRMGLALLSALSPASIYQAIANQDKASLTQAEGVGPKLAARILTELKDKVPAELGFSAISGISPMAASSLSSGVEEAVSALMNLGYKRFEAVAAMTSIQAQEREGLSLSDLIRQGLSILGGAKA